MGAQQHLRALTTFRIFAALWVVLFDYWHLLRPGPLPPVLASGYLGVELFFVLSGFIICHVYLERYGSKDFSYRSFLWARLARVYPLHVAILAGLMVLLGAAALAGISAGDNLAVWSSVPAQLLLVQAWGASPDGGWNHPAWSISAEWFAYVTFPLTAAVAWRLRDRPGMAVCAAIGFVVAANAAYPLLGSGILTQATTVGGALRIVPCFLLGSAVYLLWRQRPLTSRAVAQWATIGASLAIVGATAARLPDATVVVLSGLLIFSMASLASTGSSWMTSKAGVYLGEVSFSVYMVCIPYQLLFVEGARRLLHLSDGPLPFGIWLLLCAGIIPAAMSLHHLVERPARDLMRNWEKDGFPFPRMKTLVGSPSA